MPRTANLMRRVIRFSIFNALVIGCVQFVLAEIFSTRIVPEAVAPGAPPRKDKTTKSLLLGDSLDPNEREDRTVETNFEMFTRLRRTIDEEIGVGDFLSHLFHSASEDRQVDTDALASKVKRLNREIKGLGVSDELRLAERKALAVATFSRLQLPSRLPPGMTQEDYLVYAVRVLEDSWGMRVLAIKTSLALHSSISSQNAALIEYAQFTWWLDQSKTPRSVRNELCDTASPSDLPGDSEIFENVATEYEVFYHQMKSTDE